ncbi:DEAD/DEAH box helicase family protein [Chondrinema litorale]|uniref:DEAD/DEAH box helicase family protein n=1 Tax=Chondrinema litorale TaxID=2994555 RepID=UPI0025429C70|nr:DEAD/DEAH box helicase family protein [Chondrinema litorale]UZS00056.1 DEAD/DEAH box helicase family protein [Chondrinema litorale]
MLTNNKVQTEDKSFWQVIFDDLFQAIEADGGEKIYQYHFPNWIPFQKKNIYSPFSEGKNPTFHIYPSHAHDFRTGESYSPWQLHKKITGLSDNKEIAKELCDLYNITIPSKSERVIKSSYVESRLKALDISSEENSLLNNQSFTFKSDKDDNLVIHFSNFKGEVHFWKPETAKDYKIWARKRLKKPLEVLNKDGKADQIKYLTERNAGNRSFQNGIFQYFYKDNCNKLHEIETLVFTEGELKAFKAAKHGIAAVGLVGIHNFGKSIKNESGRTERVDLLEDIKELLNNLPSLKSVVFLHDNDCLKQSKDGSDQRKISFYSSVRNFKLAFESYPYKLHYAHIKPELGDDCKGIDDLLVCYKKKENDIKKAIYKLKNSSFFTFYNLNHISNNEIRKIWRLEASKRTYLNINQYLGEINSLLSEKVEQYKKVILKSGCGTGKTTWISNYAKENDKRLILVVPYMALTQQLRNRMEGLGMVCIDGNSTKEDIQSAKNSKLVSVTYDSLQKVVEGNDKEECLLAVDEYHNLVNQEHFRADACLNVFKALKSFQNVVLLSGTPHFLYEELGFNSIIVKAKKQNKVVVTPIRYKNKISWLLSDLAKQPTGKLNVIRCKTVLQLKQIKDALIDTGTDKKSISCIYNHDFLDADPTWEMLIQKNLVPQDVKILLCTAKINDGVNIENKNVGKVYIVDENNMDSFIQFVARFRNIDNLDVNSLHSQNENKWKKYVNEKALYADYKEFAEAIIDIINSEKDIKVYAEKLGIDYDIQLKTRETIVSDLIEDDCEFNELAAFKRIQNEQYKFLTKDEFYHQLRKKYNHITVLDNVLTDGQTIISENNIKQKLNDKSFWKFALIEFYSSLDGKRKKESRQLKKDIDKFLSENNYEIYSPFVWDKLINNQKEINEKYGKLVSKLAFIHNDYVIKQAKSNIENSKEDARIQIINILKSEYYWTFFKTLYHVTKNTSLKHKLKNFFDGYNYKPGSSALLLKEHEFLFKEYDNLVRNIANDYLFLYEFFGNHLSHNQRVKYVEEIENFTDYRAKAKTALLLHYYVNDRSLLTKTEQQDAEIMLSDINILQDIIKEKGDIKRYTLASDRSNKRAYIIEKNLGEKIQRASIDNEKSLSQNIIDNLNLDLTVTDITKCLNDNRLYKALYLDGKQIGERIKYLFMNPRKYRSVRNGRKETFYEISSLKNDNCVNLKDVCDRVNVDTMVYINKLPVSNSDSKWTKQNDDALIKENLVCPF